MSIHLDPKAQPPSIPNPESKPNSKLNGLRYYFELYVNSVYDGYLIENNAKNDCLNKWNKGQKDSATQTFEQFIENCTKECEDYKQFVEWNRRH